MRNLYHHILIAGCRAVRIALAEKRVQPVNLITEPFWQEREEFFALNPACQVPVLQEKNYETIVCGTVPILEYLEEAYPDISLHGNDFDDRAEIRRMIEWFEGVFSKEVTELIVYEKYYKKLIDGAPIDSSNIRKGSNNLPKHLDYIGWLVERRGWLACNKFSFADIVAVAHLSSLDYVNAVPWEHNQTARDWYSVVKSRPSFREILNDRIPAFAPPEHYSDLDF